MLKRSQARLVIGILVALVVFAWCLNRGAVLPIVPNPLPVDYRPTYSWQCMHYAVGLETGKDQMVSFCEYRPSY